MKTRKVVLITLASAVILALSGCTQNANPFEMLLGIIPIGDVDFMGLPNITVTYTEYTNGSQIGGWQEDSDIAVVGSNVIVLRRQECLIVSTNGTGARGMQMSNTYQNYYGIDVNGTNVLTTIRGEKTFRVALLYTTNTDYHFLAPNGGYGDGGREFYDFQAKMMKINPADGSYWFIRYHEPIETDNNYPNSDESPTYEMIRKYTYPFNLSALDKFYDNPRHIFTMRVPGGRCYGMAFHRGKLYLMYNTPSNEDGNNVHWYDTSSKTVFRMDPNTLKYEAQLNIKFNYETHGLASDGNFLFTIGTVKENSQTWKQTSLVRIVVP